MRDVARAWANHLVEEEDAQGNESNRLTLGELAKLAEVPYDFAREAVREGLLRSDKGRTSRRKRYRRRLSNWLAKLHTLREGGMSWCDIHDWTERRWKPENGVERLWPTPLGTLNEAGDASKQ